MAPVSASYNYRALNPAGGTFSNHYFSADGRAPLTAPFPVKFGDDASGFSTVNVFENGYITFSTVDGSNGVVPGLNSALPSTLHGKVIAPLWDDMDITSYEINGGTGVLERVMRHELQGISPNREWVIEWYLAPHATNLSTANRVTYQVVLFENSSDVLINYQDVTFGDVAIDGGKSATIGIQTSASQTTTQGYNQMVLADGQAWLWQTSATSGPIAKAGVDQEVAASSGVSLDGSSSLDPLGSGLTYAWTQLTGNTVTLSGASTANASFTAPAAAGWMSFRLTVTDADGLSSTDDIAVNVTAAVAPGALSLASATTSVDEFAASVTVTVNRTGGSDGAVSIDYATSDGTATAGSDYTAKSGTLNFAAGILSQSFNVTLTDDAIDESDETFTIGLSNPGGGASLGATTTSTITLVDDEVTASSPGSLAVVQMAYSVSESAPSVTVLVSRTGGSDGIVTVNYGTSSGTAISGADYSASSGTVTFAAGDTVQKSIVIPMMDDITDEVDETFTVTLSSPGGGATLGNAVATVTIQDDDAAPVAGTGELNFAEMSVDVNEGDGDITVNVMRTGGSTGSVTVDYTVSGGDATVSDDYNMGSGQLTFAEGATQASISISLVDDALVEGTETIMLQLSNVAGGATLGTLDMATVNIADNDSATEIVVTIGEEGGCFIATAAWGTNMASEVRFLRAFRDRHLLTNEPGRWFVRQYYTYSPALADKLREYEGVRTVIRSLLQPLVWLSEQIVSVEDVAQQTADRP